MFEAGIQGVFTVYLLDCDVTGSDCDNLGSKVANVDTGAGAVWLETTVDFPALDHEFGQGRHLGVRIVVSSASESDMIFAYGYASQRSRLTLHSEQPVRAVEAPVTEAPFTAGAADFAAETVAVVVVPEDPVVDEAPVSTASIWPWLTTLVISTVGLISVGGLLLTSLTKPGRHEGPQDGEHPSTGQTSRISVSAP
jgi:hypothetical protein